MFDCPTSASVPHATATPVLFVLSSPCTLAHGACRYFPFPAFMCSPHIKGGETLNERIALQLAEFHAFKAALDLTSKVRYCGSTVPTSQPAAVPASVLAMFNCETSMMPVCFVAHVCTPFSIRASPPQPRTRSHLCALRTWLHWRPEIAPS